MRPERNSLPSLSLHEAARAAVEAADTEYEVGDDGEHRLVRVTVPIEPWLALMRAVVQEGER